MDLVFKALPKSVVDRGRGSEVERGKILKIKEVAYGRREEAEGSDVSVWSDQRFCGVPSVGAGREGEAIARESAAAVGDTLFSTDTDLGIHDSLLDQELSSEWV